MEQVFKNLSFSEDDIEYLRGKKIFNEEFLKYLGDFKFSGDIYAIPEGTVVFPNEPIVTVRAKVMEAQFIETMLLLSINHQSLIATKANRVVTAANGRVVMDLGARRGQGADAAILGARAAIIGGVYATATTITGKDFGVDIVGTMAHSWVQFFGDEYMAFEAYAKTYPDNCMLLVDTYSVLKSGIPNAIRIAKEVLEPMGKRLKGIRLDSGDLSYLSKKARKMLDDAGFPDAEICASSDLDEYLIDSLLSQGACIDSWGVGTNLITSKNTPAFGGVYKLAAVEIDGEMIPKIKLSENPAKITNPGNKTVYRIYDKESGKIRADYITLADETFDESEDLLLFDPNATWKKTRLEGGTYTMKEILVPIFKNGQCVYDSPSVMEIQKHCKEQLETMWEESRRLVNPQEVFVDLSDKLYEMKKELLNEVGR